jgi:sialate O-acetylesterase
MPYHVSLRRAVSLALLLAMAAAGGHCRVQADPPKPFLHPLFTDNMVLQRGLADPIWGWTTPGQTVTVSFNGKTATAVAGSDGKWTAKIGPFAAGGPYTLMAGTSKTTGANPLQQPETVTLKNVMVGDVWLCSGQSNMEFGVANLLQPEKVIAAANDPNIRLFTVNKIPALDPQATTTGQWQPCTPDTIKSQGTWSGFSAVAYFFGRDLQQNLHVPIGLLLSSWGGTPAEAWTSEAALRQTVPEFNPQLDQMDAARTATGTQIQRDADWYAKNDPGTPADWQAPALDDSAWKTISEPGYFQDAGVPELAGINGVVWYRRKFDLPAGAAGKDAVLHLLADDNDTTWVNGVQVGASAGYNTPRAYTVPATLLKPTGNVVAVRVLDTGGKGGIWGDPSGLNLEVPGGANLPLAGPWRVHLGVALTQAAPLPASITDNPNFPSVLYNGQISPVATFGIKGAIWYQGEANAGRDAQYRRLLPAMIGDWRSAWGEGNFPFLIVQLAGFQPGDTDWPKLREAQWLTARNVPNAGIATAIDIGNATDIHPKNKQEVGRRLALVAEAKDYGEKVPYSGPVYQDALHSGHSLILKFTHADGGLISKSGPALSGFEVAGTDGVFAPAQAQIAGKTVVVSSPKVPSPTAARYAWSGFPSCSLYNKADLPAFPFETDEK